MPDVKIITPILTISGSDGIGSSGIQADIKTITSLGGDAMTVITCMALNDGKGMKWHTLHKDVIVDQARTIMETMHPKAVKVGLIRDPLTIKNIRDEIVGCKRIVCAPGIFASDSSQLIDDESIQAIITYLIPESILLMLRCNEAEKILGMKITSNDDMLKAARELKDMGAEWVMLRGGQLADGRLTALLYGEDKAHFCIDFAQGNMGKAIKLATNDEYAQVARDMTAVAHFMGADRLSQIAEGEFLDRLGSIRAHMGDSPLRAGHAAGNARPLEGRAGCHRAAEKAVPPAEGHFPVGADVQKETASRLFPEL